jgi:hypothetical protein
MANDPMAIDIPKKHCTQLDTVDYADEQDNYSHSAEETCGRELVFERHGDEVVFMCTEHGWQATVFEERSGDRA